MDEQRRDEVLQEFMMMSFQVQAGLGPFFRGGPDRWHDLKHVITGQMISLLVDNAKCIKEARSRAVYQFLQARRVTAAGEAFDFEAPPESTFLELAKGFHKGSLPAFLALGIGDQSPGTWADDTEDEELGHKSYPVFFEPGDRDGLVPLVDGFKRILDAADEEARTSSPSGAQAWKGSREVIIAGLVCMLLCTAESLEQMHYYIDIRWLRLESLYKKSGNTSVTAYLMGGGSPTNPFTRPPRPPILHFLPALREAAKAAFPVLGIQVDDNGQ